MILTFIVWYKCLYVALGITARMMYVGFYIPANGNLFDNNSDIKNNKSISKLEYNINEALLIVDFVLYIFRYNCRPILAATKRLFINDTL